MFQYAYARARSAEGIPVFLDLKKAYIQTFPTLRNNSLRENSIQNFNITLPSMDVEKYRKYFYLRKETLLDKSVYFLAERKLWPYSFVEEKSEFYSQRIASLRGDVYIKGWFQDIRYFEGIRKELLREFTPRKRIQIPSEVLKMIRNKDSVAIHVRRGDYVRLGRALPTAYYIKAKKMIEQKMKNPIFFIFSDDYEWVKNHIDWGREVFYIDEMCGLKDYEQLFVMSRCHSQVTANSTFSWWAAWLNSASDKIVIMPKKYIYSEPGLEIQGSILI